MANLGALPTAPAGIGTDPEAQTAYLDALTKVADSLQNRGGTNYFNLAQGFLSPTKTGSFGESLGNAAGAMGKDIEREKELAPSLAMMRAQIAGQKYTMQNDAKALNLMAGAMGVEPSQVEQAMTEGNMSQGQMNRLSQLYPVVASLSPTRGAIVKDMFGMQKDIKAGFDSDVKNQLSTAELNAKYGDSYVNTQLGNLNPLPSKPAPTTNQNPFTSFVPASTGVSSPFGSRENPTGAGQEMHSGIDIKAPEGSPVLSPMTGKVINAVRGDKLNGNMVTLQGKDGNMYSFSHLGDFEVKPGQELNANDPIGTIGVTGRTTGPHLHLTAQDPTGNRIDPASIFSNKPAQGVQVASNAPEKLPGESQATYQDRIKETNKVALDINKGRQEKADVVPQASMDAISTAGNYQTVRDNNNQLSHLKSLIKENPDVVDLMNKNKIFSSIGSLVQSGVNTPWGSVNADVNSAIQKSLPLEKQAIARQISQIIYQQNQNVMKSSKSIFGPQISNADVTLMSKPGIQPEDPSGYITHMADRMMLNNTYQSKINDSMNNWLDNNPNTPRRKFFDSKENYRNIINEYSDLQSHLMKGR